MDFSTAALNAMDVVCFGIFCTQGRFIYLLEVFIRFTYRIYYDCFDLFLTGNGEQDSISLYNDNKGMSMSISTLA